MELRDQALKVLCTADPAAKVHGTQALYTALQAGLQADAQATFAPVLASSAEGITSSDATSHPQAGALPGRPPRPRCVAPSQVPQRSIATAAGRAALLHAIAHIEFNAINLALDAVWRFGGLPTDYYSDWLRVASEEAHHFTLLRDHLRSLGHDYGDFDAHDGLWTVTDQTRDDLVARMALVPRALEARGLDATPPIQAKLRQAGDRQAVAILDVILRDEIGHVAIGNHWYHWLCERQGLDPVVHDALLWARYATPRPKPPFNLPARRAAGFTDAELDRLPTTRG
jgi:uncharacterized ferritin-like protein (DUF455 family)